MPVNKLALIRYKTIDECLRNTFRKWTLDDLVNAVSDSLYEYEGISQGVGRRTIQLDIQNMRSDKLGYNAPIVVSEKKFYSYSDKEFSITNSPLNDQDLGALQQVLDLFRQFKSFGHFSEMEEMVTRLEDKIFSQTHKGKSFIDFEKNDLLKGLEWIDPIHKSLIRSKPLMITYQSFKAREAGHIHLHPYLLKEYRNRWFLLGKKDEGQLITLALDRIIAIKVKNEKYVKPDFDVKEFYADAIGVTKNMGQKVETIRLAFMPSALPYVRTKPIHSSQKILDYKVNGWPVVEISVVHNFELEREILGFGEQVRVVAPRRLRQIIRRRVKRLHSMYEATFGENPE